MEEAKKTLIDFVIRYGFQLMGAAIILTIGVLAARWLGNIVRKWLDKRDLEPPVKVLMVRVIRLLVMGMTAVIAIQKLGVEIAPLIAGIGVAGVGIGLAMQGVLSNIVAGLTIIFTKPFRVGEFIQLLGVQGQVSQIELFSTTLAHADRSRVVIPNRKIVGEILHNYGVIRQLDLTVSVAYDSDLRLTIEAVNDVLQKNPRVLEDPAPVVGVGLLADSAISLVIRPWVKVPDFGPAGAEIYQAIVERFRADRIEIPFPQQQVRLLPGPPGSAAA